MIRYFCIVLGIGLVVMWIAGLSTDDSPAWMNWLDLVAGIGAFIIAGAVNEIRASRYHLVIGPVLLASGLILLWIAGLSTNASFAMSWWNFAFGVAFAVLAIFGGTQRRAGERTIEIPFRRSA